MKKQTIMAIIVIAALVLYVWGLVVIGSASLTAKEKAPVINNSWVEIVAAVTTVLAMNAGAYLGLPERRLAFDLKDPQQIRGWATLIYFLALLGSFIISVSSKHPHSSLTDMGGTLVGFLTGVLTVFLGKE
jgi:hypothetical protein